MLNNYDYNDGGFFTSSNEKKGIKYHPVKRVSLKRKECDAFFEENFGDTTDLVSVVKKNKKHNNNTETWTNPYPKARFWGRGYNHNFDFGPIGKVTECNGEFVDEMDIYEVPNDIPSGKTVKLVGTWYTDNGSTPTTDGSITTRTLSEDGDAYVFDSRMSGFLTDGLKLFVDDELWTTFSFNPNLQPNNNGKIIEGNPSDHGFDVDIKP
jgi:hypothetical protein